MAGARLASAILLVEGTGAFTLEQILEYRVTDECWSLFNVDGSLRHTTASNLLEYLNI